MKKILEEVKAITSDAVAKKQDAAKTNMPKLISQIKGAAALGKTSCEFMEHDINEWSRKLLQDEGFSVNTTSRKRLLDDYKAQYFENKLETIWVVSW